MPTKVLQFNDFGLVAITRKRVKQLARTYAERSLLHMLRNRYVKSPATVCNEIFIELRKMRKHSEGTDILIRVHPETVKVLKGGNAHWLSDFEELSRQERADQERPYAASGTVRHSGMQAERIKQGQCRGNCSGLFVSEVTCVPILLMSAGQGTSGRVGAH